MAVLTSFRPAWSRQLAVGWLSLLLLVAAVAPLLPLPYPPGLPDLAEDSEDEDVSYGGSGKRTSFENGFGSPRRVEGASGGVVNGKGRVGR